VDEQYYKCFGCGESGDVFSFIMKAENLDFLDALKFLANRVGLEMPSYSQHHGEDRNSVERRTILEINREAGRYFFAQLTHSERAMSYMLRVRKLSKKVARDTYYMGYAPNSWNGLTQHLRSLNFSDENILKSGLAKRNDKGVLYDFFRDRLVVPILDVRNNFIAFGGRALDNDTKPKYLNSPDTPVFKKSENLFSLNLAKKSVSKSRYFILAEGYMDVIALYQGGFTNAVASLGTSLTPEQVSLIKRYADEVIVCYDSDSAGINATNRAIGLLLNGSTDKELKIRVLRMVGAKDPDEYIGRYGSKSFQELLDGSVDAIEFQLEQVRCRLNLNTNSGKAELLKHSANILAQIPSNTTREVYVSSVARECNIEPSTFSETINSIIQKNNRLPIKRDYRPDTNYQRNIFVPMSNTNSMGNVNDTLNTINYYADRSKVRLFEAERLTIAYLTTIYDLIPYAKDSLEISDFSFNTHRVLFQTLCEHAEALSNLNDISIVHSDLTEEHFNSLLEIYNKYKLVIDYQNAQWGLADCIDKLKEPKIPVVDGKKDLYQIRNKKLLEEKLKHKNVT
jgi:DNA primase